MNSRSQNPNLQLDTLRSSIVKAGDDSDEGGQLSPVPEEQEAKDQRDPDETAEDNECDDDGPADAAEVPLRQNSRVRGTPKATARPWIVVLDWGWKAAVFILLLIIVVVLLIIALGIVKTGHTKTEDASAIKEGHVDLASGPATSSVGSAAPTAGPTAAREPKPPETPGFKMVKFMLNSTSLPACKSNSSSTWHRLQACRDRIWIKMVLASGTPKELGPLWCLSRHYSFASDEGGCDDSRDDFYRLTATGIEIRQAGHYHVTVQVTAHREKRLPAAFTKSDDQSLAAARKPVAISLHVNEKVEVSQTTRSIDPSSPDEGDVTAALSTWLWLSAGDVISVVLELPLGQSLLGLKISTKAAETYVQLVMV